MTAFGQTADFLTFKASNLMSIFPMPFKLNLVLPCNGLIKAHKTTILRRAEKEPEEGNAEGWGGGGVSSQEIHAGDTEKAKSH
ncbi:hypothetical protein SRHO_G00018170 [Serrasalmus rhombeus]